MIPSPSQVGLPSKFDKWRPGQAKAIEDGLAAKSRFVVQAQRPGAGKTLTYTTQTLLLDSSRCMSLTSTKGLQDHLLADFAEIGLTDIRGHSSYDCIGNPGYTCADGKAGKCAFKGSSMCTYNAAKQAICEARLGTTNYACWIANRHGGGFGKYDVLILDEAHNAPQELERAMQITLSDREITETLQREWPDHRSTCDMEAWKHWAAVSCSLAENRQHKLKSDIDLAAKLPYSKVKELQHIQNLVRRLADVAMCNPEKWVVESNNHGYQFDPVEVSAYAERVIFRGVEKVILTSATIRPRTMEMLGVSDDDFSFFDYPGRVDVHRSPLMYIPTTKVNYYSQPWELRKMVARIDEIFESRMDRKGIVHTSNYKLRDFIMANSKYSRFYVSNYVGNGDLTSAVIDQFKAMDPPALLVSPSVTTGYDFPYETCRFQIIAKLNYPYAGSKVEKARESLDPKRGAYQALQSLSQAFGRGDRAPDDYQEVFILDDAMPTLKWKYGDLAPAWLWAYYRELEKVPKAMVMA